MKMSDVLPPRSVLNPLLKEMAQSPHIALFEGADMKNLADEETVRFFYEGDDLLGIGAWQQFDDNWCELGPFYIYKKKRGTGYGKAIIKRIMTVTQHYQQYAVTKNATAKHIFSHCGLQEVNPIALPPVVVQHLNRKLTLRRVGQMLRKFSMDLPVHYISPSATRP